MRGLAYSLAADTVVVIHFAWIIFLIGGSLIGRRVRWVMWLHIFGLTFSIPLQVFSWICPLTTLEVWLRSRGTADGSYSGDFIVHYLEKLVYMEVPRSLLLLLTGVVIVVSAVVYSKVISNRSCYSKPT